MAGVNDLELHHVLKLLLNGCEFCETLAIRTTIHRRCLSSINVVIKAFDSGKRRIWQLKDMRIFA